MYVIARGYFHPARAPLEAVAGQGVTLYGAPARWARASLCNLFKSPHITKSERNSLRFMRIALLSVGSWRLTFLNLPGK